MKKMFFLTALVIQSSFCCFAQIDTTHHYTDAEILKISNCIMELESKNATLALSETNAADKKSIHDLLNDNTHAYTDLDVIKLVKYIKALEKSNDIAKATVKNNVLYINQIVKDSVPTYSNYK